jgi:ABC-type lipoprotein export system ATPase subunit
MDVLPASSTAIVGRSGSGKSTLISVLSLLRSPASGSVRALGREIGHLSDSDLSRLRSTLVGTVFQSFHLDPSFSAADNVMLPWYFGSGGSRRVARARALEVLEVLGIADLARRLPGEMSGGQRQRVAIARALFTAPPLLIADEPTGNLDRHTADKMFDLLREINRDLGIAFVIVTHDPALAALAHRQLHMQSGNLAES